MPPALCIHFSVSANWVMPRSCGPDHIGQLGVLLLDGGLEVCLCGILVHVAGEVILERILEALVQALIVGACVGHIDLLCSLGKQGDMVLAAQEVGACNRCLRSRS